MYTPYDEMLAKMNEAIGKEIAKAGDASVTIDPARAAAEVIGLREMMEALAKIAALKGLHADDVAYVAIEAAERALTHCNPDP